ncbi:MAG: M23B-like peptidase [Candidatus Saganbacteria bacterium]|uniref:M23B-like peptidase n=1 Tax=Candidatus Saganbacteria bacterium TaxID=2575572 RepID=A0A833NRA9_UNCSA|nr:MAG: M23B-like peptidase [Candidatus Saganbacteria bacterium]
MKRILALFFLLLFISVSLSEDITDERLKLKRIQEQLNANKKQLSETKKKEQESLTKLVTIKTELKKASRALNKAKTKIVANEGEIKDLSSEINETEETLGQKSVRIKKRIREVYKSSAVNYLDLLFFARNMSDFISRAYFFGKVIEGDAKLISEITVSYNQIRSQKDRLVGVTNEIKDLALEIGEKKQEISEKAEEEKTLLGTLKQRRAKYEKEIAQLERSSEELERVIQAKMAERKKSGVSAHGSGSLDWPLRGRMTSYYGYRRHPLWGGRSMHTGIDIAAPHGEVIRSADGGEVIFSGWWDGYGKAAVIDHGKNISTVYGHMSRIYVQNGNKVSKGQIIGLVGSTGYSTGPHLHFEVRKNGKPTNPMKYLP